MLKVGTLLAGSSTTLKPFFSVASSARGSFTFKISLLTGALPLTTAPFVLGAPCPPGAPPWPTAKDDTNTTSSSAAMMLLLYFMILIAMTPLLSRRAGCGLGLRLRHCDYNRAARVDKIFVSDALHVFLCDCGNFIETAINQARL